MRWWCIVVTALLAVGCATSTTVTSSPPAVAVFDGDRRLGETPLELSSVDAKSQVSNGHLLRLEKDGFHRVWVWVPSGLRGTSVVVNLQPFARGEAKVGQRDLTRVEMDLVGAKVLDLQKELLLKGAVPDDALQDLLTRYQDVGAVHYLAAVNHLRQGKSSDAKDEARRALDLAPGEPDYVVLYRELGGDPAESAPDTAAEQGVANEK